MNNFQEFIDKVNDIEDKRKELLSRLFKINSEQKRTVTEYIIDIIKKYGVEKDGWIELDLGEDGVVVRTTMLEYNAAGSEYGAIGIALMPYWNQARIKKLKLATETRYIREVDGAKVLVSLASGYNSNHIAQPDTIIMDLYYRDYKDLSKKDDFAYTWTYKGLYFSDSYSMEEQIEFVKRLNEFIKEKYKERVAV